MHRDRLRPEELGEGGREHVLRGVLLHVVKPALPVHDPVHLAGGRDPWIGGRRLHNVDDLLTAVDDVAHGQPGQGSGVVRLSSGGRVEGRAVEDDARERSPLARRPNRGHPGVEDSPVRVRIIKAFSHSSAGEAGGPARRPLRPVLQ